VTQARMDDNDKARFLEATMAEEERARAVAHLSTSDEDAEDIGDAAYLLREMEGGGVLADEPDAAAGSTVPGDAEPADDGTKVIPFRPPSTQRPRRRIPAQWLALAAVLAGVLLVPFALSRSGSRGLGDPGEYAAQLSNRQAGLSADWINDRPWSTTRSGGTGDPLAENARAARLGALHVDLEIAAAAGQGEQMAVLCGQIQAQLGQVTNGGVAAAPYEELCGSNGLSSQEQQRLLRDGSENLVAFLPADYVSLGAWAEAARLAAQRRDPAFFDAKQSRKALDQLPEIPEITPSARAAAEQVHAAVQAGVEGRWDTLETALADLLKELGR
jgi:hypothetical protein